MLAVLRIWVNEIDGYALAKDLLVWHQHGASLGVVRVSRLSGMSAT
jgi:hypothetical protein